jgi:hypothetical protein
MLINEAVLLINCCLTRLSINFALATKLDGLIDLESIVIGISGYDTFKDDFYGDKTSKLDYLATQLYLSLKKNRFVYHQDYIDIVDDMALANTISCQLVKNNIITANTNVSYDTVWTFWLSSIVVAMRSKKNLLTTDVKKYLPDNEGGYYCLGKDAAEFFSIVEDKKNVGSNKVQQLINKSVLSKKLLDKRGYSLSYWLRKQPRDYIKNNTRGLAVVEYVLNNIKDASLNQNTNSTDTLARDNKLTVNLQTATQTKISQQPLTNNNLNDNSLITAKQYSLNLIATGVNAIKNLISTQEQPNISKNDIILISGELLRSKFIKENYIKTLNDSISDARIRDRIQLINQENFIYGLTLASECIKKYFLYDSDDNTEMLEAYSSESSEEIENLTMFRDLSYSDSDVFLSDSDNTSNEILEIPTEEDK